MRWARGRRASEGAWSCRNRRGRRGRRTRGPRRRSSLRAGSSARRRRRLGFALQAPSLLENDLLGGRGALGDAEVLEELDPEIHILGLHVDREGRQLDARGGGLGEL